MYTLSHSPKSFKIAAVQLLTLEQFWGKLKIVTISTSGLFYFTTTTGIEILKCQALKPCPVQAVSVASQGLE